MGSRELNMNKGMKYPSCNAADYYGVRLFCVRFKKIPMKCRLPLVERQGSMSEVLANVSLC